MRKPKLPDLHLKPKGPHGRAADKAVGQTHTTGRFKAIEKSAGKGAAIAAYQRKLENNKCAMGDPAACAKSAPRHGSRPPTGRKKK